MDHQEFSSILNNMKGLSLRQIFKLIINLQYKTILIILAIISGALGGAFAAGKCSIQKETAVMLESPFDMRLVLDGKQYDFENLTLNKDPTMIAPSKDKMALSLREIQGSFDIVPVGKVIAQIEDTKLSIFWGLLVSDLHIIEDAHAHPDNKENFDWKGHENDFKFKEQFVSKDTVHRYYSDSCVLEYKVDSNRKSVPSSFVWLEINH